MPEVNYNYSNLKQKLEAKDFLPNINCTQTTKGPKTPFFVPGDLDLWPSNSSERGTKRVFRVSLVRICSVVPEININNHRLPVQKTEPFAVHCVVMINIHMHSLSVRVPASFVKLLSAVLSPIKQNFLFNCSRFSTRKMPILSPNQQQQTTTGKSQHWLQPKKITHKPNWF